MGIYGIRSILNGYNAHKQPLKCTYLIQNGISLCCFLTVSCPKNVILASFEDVLFLVRYR